MGSKNGTSANGNGHSRKGKAPAIVRQWITKLDLENVRCFGKKVSLDFCVPGSKEPAQWNVIVGDNGAGKTTVLRAICMLDHENLHSFSRSEPGYFIRTGSTKEGIITFHYFNQSEDNPDVPRHNITPLEFKHDGSIHRPNSRRPPPLYGFGAVRKVSSSGLGKNFPGQHLNTLINDERQLLNPESLLLMADYTDRLKKNRRSFQMIKGYLLQVLSNEVKDIDIVLETQASEGNLPQTTPTVKFQTRDGWMKISDLSLGYRTLIAWVVDFAMSLWYQHPKSNNPFAESAIVLVDEIDLHLHPKFQRKLKEDLTTCFPNTQFIMTAHSPLMLQGDEDTNLILLKRRGDEVVVKNKIEQVRSWRIEQLLDSEVYEHAGGFPAWVQKLMKEREKLILKGKLTKAEKQRLEDIEMKLPPPANYSPIEIKAMELIRKAAKEVSVKK